MPPTKNQTFTFTAFLILCLSYSSAIQTQPKYVEKRPKHTFPVTTSSSHFSMELDYPRAFQVKIEAFNSQEGQTGFCNTFPSKVDAQVTWTGPLGSNNTAQEEIQQSYDNIAYYEQYYFILDSVTFNIIATKDVTDASSYLTIPSEFMNDVNDGRPEDAYLVISADDHILYIVTSKKLYYYNLNDFINAVTNKQAVPSIKDQALNFHKYESLVAVKCYKSRLYIVADNIIEAYLIEAGGTINREIVFNNNYFGADKIFLTSVAFKGNNIFILDKLRGVYVIDISNVNKVHEDSMRSRYWFQSNAVLDVPNGQLIEIIRNSLHVISVGSKTPILREYIIVGDQIFQSFVFNRQVELYQSVRDTYSDSNFLFILTGYFNMVGKHSIPGRFGEADVKEYLNDYWPLFGTKAMVSIPASNSSKVVALHNNQISTLKVFEKNPMISCNMAGVEEGLHRYRILAVQKECTAKNQEKPDDFNAVCEIYQNIDLLVIQESAEIGDTARSKKTVIFLTVGISVMLLIVIIFVFLFKKYKTQYHRLEDEIKFYRLEDENENEDQIIGDGFVKSKKMKVGGSRGRPGPAEIELGAKTEDS